MKSWASIKLGNVRKKEEKDNLNVLIKGYNYLNDDDKTHNTISECLVLRRPSYLNSLNITNDDTVCCYEANYVLSETYKFEE